MNEYKIKLMSATCTTLLFYGVEYAMGISEGSWVWFGLGAFGYALLSPSIARWWSNRK